MRFVSAFCFRQLRVIRRMLSWMSNRKGKKGKEVASNLVPAVVARNVGSRHERRSGISNSKKCVPYSIFFAESRPPIVQHSHRSVFNIFAESSVLPLQWNRLVGIQRQKCFVWWLRSWMHEQCVRGHGKVLVRTCLAETRVSCETFCEQSTEPTYSYLTPQIEAIVVLLASPIASGIALWGMRSPVSTSSINSMQCHTFLQKSTSNA